MNPKEAEELAKIKLEKRFKKTFDKHKEIRIGGNPWSFDLVSEDSKIIAQVKSRQKKITTKQQFETLFKRDYVFDCLLLEKVEANIKIFYLAADRDLFNKFKKKVKGLISPEVKLKRLIL